MSEFPSVTHQIKTAAGTIINVIGGTLESGNIFVSEEEKERRYKTCSLCQFFEYNSQRCQKCGCYMNQKVKFIAAHCPIQKW